DHALGWLRRLLELVVQPRADDVRVELDVVRRHRSAGRAAIELAEIDVEIFELGRPVADEGVFDAKAGGPAGLRLAGAGEAWRRRLDVAERAARGDVGQEAVERVADAAAQGGEPAELGLAAERAIEHGRALDVGPVVIAFDAEHPGAGLDVVAGGEAGQRAGDVERAGVGRRRVPAR